MTTDWRALALNLQPQARLFAPATEEELAETERAIGDPLPPELRALCSQTNGMLDEWEYGPIQPLSRLVEQTLFWRTVDLAAEFDNPDLSLASFVVIGADAGGGPFGFSLGAGEEARIQHLDGEAGIFADTTFRLGDYLRYYFDSLSSFSV
ncbi:MAG: SMI1/KNR4 family protein [Actinomycetota bacterium]